MKWKFGLLILITTSLLQNSCTHYPLDPIILIPYDSIPLTGCDPDSVYFEQQILPIFQSNCAKVGCHDAQSHEEGLILDNYTGIMEEITPFDLGDSEAYEVITANDQGDIMPPPPDVPLSQTQISLIGAWIVQGAQNNVCNSLDCDTTNVTFGGSVMPIINLSCKGCHSGGQPDGGILLTNYNEVSAQVLNGKLLATIEHQVGFTPMPYNAAQLPACQIAMIQIWVANGYPND